MDLINASEAWIKEKVESFLKTSTKELKFGDPRVPVSLGLIDGMSIVNVSGVNTDIDTNNTEIIATMGQQVYPYPTVQDTITIVSDNVNDTAAGTGARTVRVLGLDENYLEVLEDIILDGATPVVSTIQFLRINQFIVLTAGSDGGNQGTISLNHTTSGDLLSEIIISGDGVSLNRAFSSINTIPSGKVALISGALPSITRRAGGSGTKEGEISLRVRPFGGIFIPSNITGLRSDGTTSLQVILNYADVIPEKSDIEFIANSFSGNTSITIGYTYLLLDKAILGLE